MNRPVSGLTPASVIVAEAPPPWLDRWSEFAAGFNPERLPEHVVEQAKLVMLDTIGVIASGMMEPEMHRLAVRMVRHGAGPVAVIGAGIALRGDDAAFLNGTAGTALELDEGNQFSRGHPAIHVLPALLSAAIENRRTGADVLSAFVMGYEICARLGAATRLNATVHPHGTWGTVGAALAVALMAGADASRLACSINTGAMLSLAASQKAMLEGATVRNVYCGVSNSQGLRAWDLVASGFSAEKNAIGSVYGSILSHAFAPQVMTEGLAERFEIERNYFKRHAACRYTHAAIDALEVLVSRHGAIAAEQVERIDVATYALAAQLDNPQPGNSLAAKFSVPFSVATTLINGSASVSSFREAALENDAIRRLARRVVVVEDPSLTAALPHSRPARVKIMLKNGVKMEAEAFSSEKETAYSVREKFRQLAVPVWGEAHCETVAAEIDALHSAPDTDRLNRLLTACPKRPR